MNGYNNYTAPPTPHCLNQDVYLPLSDLKFSSQDYQIKQPQKTLAYAKVLQHWAEKAKPPTLGKPHQLAECIQELRETMEPLTTFRGEEVFCKVTPSN